MRKIYDGSRGIRLLKKGQKGLIHAVFSRLGLIVLLLALQTAVLFGMFRWFEGFLPHIMGGRALFTAGMVLYLLNSRLDPTAKITWLIFIMLLPVFGSLLFWYTQSNIGHRAVKARLSQLTEQTRESIPQSRAVLDNLAAEYPGAASLARYIRRSGCYPVFDRTAVTYFPTGEEKWEEMLRQLETAEHFIFLEYFIVDEGVMWGEVLEILVKKAAAGVDVRVMYDGTCEFSTLPHGYPKLLRERAGGALCLHPLQLPGPPEDPSHRRPCRLQRRRESGGRVYQPYCEARPLEGHRRHAEGGGGKELYPDVFADVGNRRAGAGV